MGFSRLFWPIAPFNNLGTSFILPLLSYVFNYFHKAIVFTTSDEMVNLLCSCIKMILINSKSHWNHLQSNFLDIETIEITNKHTCRVISLTQFFQLPTRPNFPSPQERRTRERFSQQYFYSYWKIYKRVVKLKRFSKKNS